MQHDHKGWYVPRGLPHLDAPGIVQAITFRLADALPHDVALARQGEGDAAHRRRIAAALDAGHGACILREPPAASIVESALFHGAGERYELIAWVIMPNHVHALIAPTADRTLPAIVQAWKSWTAKAINRERGRSGTVWQREYFDRFIRDDRHLAATIAYVEENPVKSGLAATPADWRFGSAWWRANGKHASRGTGGRASRAPTSALTQAATPAAAGRRRSDLRATTEGARPAGPEGARLARHLGADTGCRADGGGTPPLRSPRQTGGRTFHQPEGARLARQLRR